jgi:hypothetical protein
MGFNSGFKGLTQLLIAPGGVDCKFALLIIKKTCFARLYSLNLIYLCAPPLPPLVADVNYEK